MLEKVGKLLQNKAIKSKTIPVDLNAYGKSAFNRYYYATYWLVRDMLEIIDPKWASQSHGDIPVLLNKKFTNKFKKAIEQTAKINNYNESENGEQTNRISSFCKKVIHDLDATGSIR